VHQHDGNLTVDVLAPRRPEPHPWPESAIRVHFPQATFPQATFRHATATGLRHHDDVVTIHDHQGRIVAVNTTTGRTVVNLTMRE